MSQKLNLTGQILSCKAPWSNDVFKLQYAYKCTLVLTQTTDYNEDGGKRNLSDATNRNLKY
ncbi:hypothetical protein JCM12294_47010 [Desulfocicer niacini]